MPDTFQTNFTAGEWSPRLWGRSDLEKYGNACRVMENFLVYPHGGVTRRPGTKFVAYVEDHDERSRLVPFVFNREQAYVLEFGDKVLRFFADRGQVVSGTPEVPYEIATPYDADHVRGLMFYQSADVCWITHQGGLYPPYKLSRLGHTSWTLAQMDFQDGPYLDENSDNTLHLTPSATTGSGVTLTADIRYSPSEIGTWSGTAGTPDEMFTSGNPIAGFQVVGLETSWQLISVDISITTPPAGAITTRAKLYTDSAGSPDTLLDTSDDQSVSGAGTVTYTFDDMDTLSASTPYWVIFESDSTDDAVRAAVVADDADYGSGQAATIGALVDDTGYDWKCALNVQISDTGTLFDEGHVGAFFRLRHNGTTVVGTAGAGSEYWTDAVQLYGKFTVDLTPDQEDGFIGKATLQQSTNQMEWYDVAYFFTSTRQEFFENKTGVYYRVGNRSGDVTYSNATITLAQAEQWGVFQVTAYVSASEVTGDVISPFGSTDPTPFWREGAWSDYRGFPSCVTLWDGRLWFSGTDHQPGWMWSSWVEDYENMMPGDTDDAPVAKPLPATNPIQWVEPHRVLVVGTLGDEWKVSGGTEGKAITRSEFVVSRQGKYGSASDIAPVNVGLAILFLQARRRKLRELAYSFDADAYQASDLCLLAEHVTEGGIVEMAYQQEPDSVVWCVRDDGELVGLTYYRQEQVVGWHRHPMSGLVESVAVIPSALGDSAGMDEVWLIVKRTINGTDVRCVERMEDNIDYEDQEDFYYLDCGLTGEYVTATTSVSGADHLVGETVSIVADGTLLDDQEVAVGGTLTLPVAANVVHIGLPYTSTIQPMRLDYPARDGTIQGKKKRIAGLILRFYRTLMGKYGRDTDHLTEIPFRAPGDYFDTPSPLFSGDMAAPFAGTWDREGNILIVQDTPLPMTLMGIVTEFVTEGA